jgi:hypothetical protein
MGFSGIRAVILIVVFIGLLLAVTKGGLPGWILPVGLLLSAALMKGSEKKAETKAEAKKV